VLSIKRISDNPSVLPLPSSALQSSQTSQSIDATPNSTPSRESSPPPASATDLPDATTTVSASTSSPFASMTFESSSPHKAGAAFAFSLQSSPLLMTPSLPSSPVVFGQNPPPPTPSSTPLHPPASLATSLMKSPSSTSASTSTSPNRKPRRRQAVSKEDMKMRSAIEENVIVWTQEEKETMLQLPRKECATPPLSSENSVNLLLMTWLLVQILLKTRRPLSWDSSTLSLPMPTTRELRW